MSDRPSNVAAEQGIVLDDSGEPKRRLHPVRRLLQFSLRGLLVLVAVCSVWLGIAFHRAREQARAVAVIAAHTDEFEVRYDFTDLDDQDSSDIPSWLLESLGIDFFHDVTSVFADNVTDDLLKAIGGLSEVRRLELSGWSITNQGLAHLNRLKHLEELGVHSSPVTPLTCNLADPSALHRLKQLAITNENVTDAALQHFKRLPNLELLVLSDTSVTPAGVRQLQRAIPDCSFVLLSGPSFIFTAGPEFSAARLPSEP
jgi:hypothetical protein